MKGETSAVATLKPVSRSAKTIEGKDVSFMIYAYYCPHCGKWLHDKDELLNESVVKRCEYCGQFYIDPNSSSLKSNKE